MLVRGMYELPHQSQVLRRDLLAKDMAAAPPGAWMGVRRLTQLDRDHWKAPYEFKVSAPGDASLAWMAFVDRASLERFARAYGLDLPVEIQRGQTVRVMVPQGDHAYLPLRDVPVTALNADRFLVRSCYLGKDPDGEVIPGATEQVFSVALVAKYLQDVPPSLGWPHVGRSVVSVGGERGCAWGERDIESGPYATGQIVGGDEASGWQVDFDCGISTVKDGGCLRDPHRYLPDSAIIDIRHFTIPYAHSAVGEDHLPGLAMVLALRRFDRLVDCRGQRVLADALETQAQVIEQQVTNVSVRRESLRTPSVV